SGAQEGARDLSAAHVGTAAAPQVDELVVAPFGADDLGMPGRDHRVGKGDGIPGVAADRGGGAELELPVSAFGDFYENRHENRLRRLSYPLRRCEFLGFGEGACGPNPQSLVLPQRSGYI